MWLQLATLLAFLLLLSQSAHAQDSGDEPRSEGRVRIYADDDHVTIVSPAVSTRFAASDAIDVALGANVDAVSAASVDVITSASPSPMHETRVQGNATATLGLSSTWRVRGGGILSYEDDYLSIRPSLGTQVEVANRNATIDLAYTAVIDSAKRAHDPMFARKRRGHIVAASVTQILDSSTYLDVLLEGRRLDGYHASPYRRVRIETPQSSELVFVEERTPSIRQSGAAMVRVRRALGASESWFAHGSYRIYRDSWNVLSHTLSARVFRSLGDEQVLLGVHLRGYTQRAANFYHPYYQSTGDTPVPRYRTRDRALSGMDSLHSSVTADTAVGPTWIRTSMSLTEFRFNNFPAQRRRRALTAELSLRAAW